MVGDIHGCFEQLEAALYAIDFDARRDRLFAVGDLIDRGPWSEQALEWTLQGPITATVLGNHEALMRDAIDPETPYRAGYEAIWKLNGGTWWTDTDHSDEETLAWYRWLSSLPYTLTVDTVHGPIGVIHAQPHHRTWAESVRACASTGHEGELARERALWSRQRYFGPSDTLAERPAHWSAGCADVRAVLVGHTPRPEVDTHQGLLNIDTGAFRAHRLKTPSSLTLARIDAEPIQCLSRTLDGHETWRTLPTNALSLTP